MRYSAVPWLEDSDLQPMGAPESSIELPGEITHGLRITAPFGRGSDAMLAVHATQAGRITLAVTSVIDVATVPLERNLQSNPRRAHGDGETGDD